MELVFAAFALYTRLGNKNLGKYIPWFLWEMYLVLYFHSLVYLLHFTLGHIFWYMTTAEFSSLPWSTNMQCIKQKYSTKYISHKNNGIYFPRFFISPILYTMQRLAKTSSIAYFTYFTSLWNIFSDTWQQLSFKVYPGQPTCSV